MEYKGKVIEYKEKTEGVYDELNLNKFLLNIAMFDMPY